MYYIASHSLWTSFSSGFSVLTGMFQSRTGDSTELQVAAVILLLAAIVMFLFIIVLLYVKAMVMFMQHQSDEDAEQRFAERTKRAKARRIEIEKEMEKELERELEKSRIQKFNTEQEEFIAKRRIIEQEEIESKRQEEEKKKRNEQYEAELRDIKIREDEERLMRERDLIREKEEESKTRKHNEHRLELDWKKGQQQQVYEVTGAQEINFQYQQQRKSLQDLMGLIINMLSRNVDDNKIAQTVKFRAQKESIEDDILQTIDAIKSFIDLCAAGKFANYVAEGLPSEEQALYNLAQGDASNCLALLERLMNENIDKAARARLEQKRDLLFAETSKYASTFASLAAITDPLLATSSFELAIEMSPKNIDAWSKLGDMYMRTDAKEKGVWAYNNLLSMADSTIYQRQVANANRALSDYYYAQGDSITAAKMYNESKRYYDAIGINEDLSNRENDIINIIESRQADNLRQIVAQLLHDRAQERRS